LRKQEAVADRLTRDLSWVGLAGGVALIVFTTQEFDLFLERASPDIPWRAEILGLIENVVLPLVILMLPIYLAARWVIRTSLAPLGAVAHRVDAVAGTERGFRLELDDLPLEILPFARAINSLLCRFDTIAERRESLVADLAHELKTPLTILILELDQLGIPEAARFKADVRNMCRLLDQIQLMAQIDAQAVAPIGSESVDAADVAGDIVAQMAPVAALQGKHLALEAVDHRPIRCRREALSAALRNLIENALRVTPPQGLVTVIAGPGSRIRVRDGGPGLSFEDLARFRARSVRADNMSADGAGLGLAIAHRIAEMHRGNLDTDPESKEIILSFTYVIEP